MGRYRFSYDVGHLIDPNVKVCSSTPGSYTSEKMLLETRNLKTTETGIRSFMSNKC